MSAHPLFSILPLVGALIMTVPAQAASAPDPHQNPDQATVDAINDRKALLEAQDTLIKSQITLIKDTYVDADQSLPAAHYYHGSVTGGAVTRSPMRIRMAVRLTREWCTEPRPPTS